eukprot:4692148-Pleurochrysis_carterae.AAC.1
MAAQGRAKCRRRTPRVRGENQVRAAQRPAVQRRAVVELVHGGKFMSNSAEGGGDGRMRRRVKRVCVTQRISDGSELHDRARVDFDGARQRKQIKVEDSVL